MLLYFCGCNSVSNYLKHGSQGHSPVIRALGRREGNHFTESQTGAYMVSFHPHNYQLDAMALKEAQAAIN